MSWTRRRVLSLPAAGAATPWSAIAETAPDLWAIAGDHVKLAQQSRREEKLWGRIGGNEAELASARMLARQLKSAGLREVHTEPFSFHAHRFEDWTLTAGGATLQSAMPAPFDARFPTETEAAVSSFTADESWASGQGKWILLTGGGGATAMLPVREKLLYQKAVAAGAAGLVFPVPSPPEIRLQAVVPVDKPYTLLDERYPDGRRPIPCFAVDTPDMARLAAASRLRCAIRYQKRTAQSALNTVARLPGPPGRNVLLFAHLDGFFSGACDNASGLATLVGLAHRLTRTPAASRKAAFWLLGEAAHHDSGAGIRAFYSDRRRFSELTDLVLIEHVDAVDSPEGRKWGWPAPLNNRRVAYVGPQGWPDVERNLQSLVRESKLMTADARIEKACIADLFVNCGQKPSFSLIQSPPFYHTNLDTLDRISRAGIDNAVDFHLRLLRAIGALV
ncbi:MAG: M28 family peptidase [Bryobacteraceae bacterium]|nr:M28 family peptidase [Bryobacteraceae bacterium]